MPSAAVKNAVRDIEGYEKRAGKANKGKSRDFDLLKVLAAQKGRSIGFDNDKELNTERADALDYYKGKHEGAVKRDLPTLANRSTVVSTDVANGVETALPDIIAVFTEGDDTITFKATGPEDKEQAKQETDYTRHIIFQQNDGWVLLYTGFKDALISKTGVFHYYWDPTQDYEEFETQASEPQIEQIEAEGNEVIDVEPTNVVSMNGFPLFNVTFRKPVSDGHVVIKNVPPEDFTVSPDTVVLRDTEYCAMRERVSRQSLIEDGYDEDVVMTLDCDGDDDDEKQARDTAEENMDVDDEGSRYLEMVDIVTHYIRLDLEGKGRRQIYRVVTGNDESVELSCEKRSMIEFAAITPFPMPHRFYGQSLADKLMQTQKWATSVTRVANDHLYFANNQRQEVKKAGIVAGVTIEQLINNEPGQPVVTEDGNSLKPIQNNTLGFEPIAYLEHIKTDAEYRTGIVRNAAGLRPDTMHETKGGAEMLVTAALKRHRMMAHLFAQTGLKDLFLGVHDLARQNATLEDTVELRGKWVPVTPSAWRRRKDMKIDIGIGSGGTEDELQKLNIWRGALSQVAEAQGGLDNPDDIVTKQTAYNALESLAEKLGIKDYSQHIQNPADVEKRKALTGETEEPQVPPEVLQAQMELKVEQETQAARIQLETEKAKTQAQIAIAKMQEDNRIKQEQMRFDMEMEREKAQLQLQLERDRAAAELQMAREKAAQELQLARDKAAAELQLAREQADLEAELAERNSIREAKIANKEVELSAENERAEIKNNRPGGSLAE